MKTVKRKAKAGEKIRTVNGSIGKVTNVWGDCIDASDINDGIEFRVFHTNYEVIIEDGPENVYEWVKHESAMGRKVTVDQVGGRLEIPPHSSHYHPGSIDVIRFAEENFSVDERRGFYRMSALKYLTRFDRKGSPLDDLEKAQFYTGKLMDLENEGRTKVTLKDEQGNVTEEFYEEGAE